MLDTVVKVEMMMKRVKCLALINMVGNFNDFETSWNEEKQEDKEELRDERTMRETNR